MASFLGHTIAYEVGYEVVSDEVDASVTDVEQVSIGGLNKRYAITFELEPETIVSESGVMMELFAHRNRYGTGTPFSFDWVQGLGIVAPAGNVALAGTAVEAVGQKLMLFSQDVPVGIFFTFAGTDTLYQCAEEGSGRARYIEPALTDAISVGTALDFSPTVQAKHRAGSGITYRIDRQGRVVPRVSLIESRD